MTASLTITPSQARFMQETKERHARFAKSRPEVTAESVVVEPIAVPLKILPPIPNEVFREAAAFSEEISRGFSDVIRVLRAVSVHTGVSITDLRSARRDRLIVRPRQYVYYLGKKLTTSSLPAIGRQLGGKDHTTVLAGIHRIELLRQTDAKIEADLQAIAASLGGTL